MEDSTALNRASWDERVAAHAASPDYALASYRSDPGFLSHVVRFDLPRLGEIRGLRGVHLQCHIGTDTISLARLGAHMTGLDYSPPAIEQAKRLAADTGADAEFVLGDVHDAPALLGSARFDLLYTGVGALCWLPEIDRWAEVAESLLAPGGRLFLREGHPMLWALDEARPDGLLAVEYPYFEREEPYVDQAGGTYVQSEATFEHDTTHTWNHGLGEVVSALTSTGLQITGLAEHDSVPWDALPGQMERVEPGEYRLIDRPWRLAASYTLQAVKPG
jgi:SAM-dependent methyltransferase